MFAVDTDKHARRFVELAVSEEAAGRPDRAVRAARIAKRLCRRIHVDEGRSPDAYMGRALLAKAQPILARALGRRAR